MQNTHKGLAIAFTAAAPANVETNLLVVPVFEGDAGDGVSAIDAAAADRVARARARGEFSGKPFEQLYVPVGREGVALVIGAGPGAECSVDVLRRLATTAGLAARGRHLSRVAMVIPRTSLAIDAVVQALAEGFTIANFEGANYKTGGDPVVWLDRVELLLPAPSDAVVAALERGRVLGECTNLARGLANEPGNALTPRAFADRAAEAARAAGLGVEVLDELRIAELRMGLLLGVARGSQEPPRLIVLRHDPPNARGTAVLGLVGKGVTFDSGGISIKPADNMDRMKDDMSGGAAVLGAMVAIATLGAPVRCVGVIPATENMPGGKATKPGDILTSAEGKTVEILNTDAEGRLILGDGLWYARQLGATHLVDVATLTGSIVVALGKTTSGLFGTPDSWVDHVKTASARAGDRSWPMPIFDDYKEQLKSEIADFTNTGGRAGGSITGALFIKEFSGGLPWVHMDIAGTAWAEEAKPYQPKGATGVAVRTLAQLALAADSWNTV